ncbi:MAG: hypothetical protein NT138_00790 [Planctomycetales bacterium]|nr:hypothetical protein [Planctomycetales bacterium]
MAKRTITVSIDEGVAKEIETLTNLTIEEGSDSQFAQRIYVRWSPKKHPDD